MERFRFVNYINGHESDNDLPVTSVISADGGVGLDVPDSDLVELLSARNAVTAITGARSPVRFGNASRNLSERIAIVRALFGEFKKQRERVVDLAHHMHGTSRRYLRDSFESLESWVAQIEEFVDSVNEFSLGRDGVAFSERRVVTPYALVTAGNFEVYESFYLLAQTILSGTHFIVRPSAYDSTTHIIIEIIASMGLRDLGQKLTWDSTKQPELIRHLLRFVPGASIFGSDQQIESMLKTSVMERYPDGHTEERIVEHLRDGRELRAYGSGNAMMVVMGQPEQAAAHLCYAKILAKGNKCWVPDGAVVLDQYVDAFYRRLIELDREYATQRPTIRESEIQGIEDYLAAKVGREPDYADADQGEGRMGLKLYTGLTADSPFFDQEITFPAVGVIPVSTIESGVSVLREILARRGAAAYLSLGCFGPADGFNAVTAQVPSEAYRLNESLRVDLMRPHQGGYFMMDPTIA